LAQAHFTNIPFSGIIQEYNKIGSAGLVRIHRLHSSVKNYSINISN